jgi:hypothetical protein
MPETENGKFVAAAYSTAIILEILACRQTTRPLPKISLAY